jgi:hypothetical protein
MLNLIGIMALIVGVISLIVPPGHVNYEIEQPAVAMEVLDQSLEPYAAMWQKEIARRFPHAVGILVHGNDFVEGEWTVGANLSDSRVSLTKNVVEHYQKLYPDRTIVLVSCNPGHLKLGIPGVYYAPASVWCVPDREMTAEMYKGEGEGEGRLTLDGRWSEAPDVVGNVYEFVTDK